MLNGQDGKVAIVSRQWWKSKVETNKEALGHSQRIAGNFSNAKAEKARCLALKLFDSTSKITVIHPIEHDS